MRTLVRLVALLALVGIGAVHLDLYAGQGYRHIPTIGPLFLLNAVLSLILAAIVAIRPYRLVALAGTGFALGTLAAYLWSLESPTGLFQFHEPGVSAAGAVAIAFEVVTAGTLGFLAMGRRTPRPTSPASQGLPHSGPGP